MIGSWPDFERDGYLGVMGTAVFVIATISAIVTTVGVIALFVWAARKDGEYDRAVQKRLGIRRRTRL